MADDSIKFTRKVSSETGDKLKFYIGTTAMDEWSGTNEGWRDEAYAVTPGTKTFRWVYSKNGSGTNGSDKGWLDNIHLPSPSALTVWAGPDESICAGAQFRIAEAYGTEYTVATWSTSGTGTFDDNTIIQPLYTPSAEDFSIGSVMLTLALSNSQGDIVTDELALAFRAAPEAPQTAQGPAYIDLYVTQTSEYSIPEMDNVIDYSWYLAPVEAGTIVGTGLNATVTWNPDYLGIAYISVTAIDECGEGEPSAALEVTVDNTVSTADLENDKLSLEIYPNPGHGLFNVRINSTDEGIRTIKLTNILGKTIITESARINDSKVYQLNLEQMPAGIYFLVVGSGEDTVTRKIVKE
jgi:hypothetical protein